MARKISELFYELRAKTEGLSKDLGESERQLGKFSKFVADNPTAVVGALAVAIVGVGVAATHMAEESDRAFRRMAVNLPEGAKGIQALKDGITSVSDETGRLRSETMSLFEFISKQGVSGAAEIETRAKAIEKFADATNASRETTAAGLDQLMDAFHITADGAELALAKIASVTKGRQDVESVIDALQSAAPSVAKFGIDYDTALRALLQLTDGFGLSAGQAGKMLKTLDKSGILELAHGATIAGDALKDMSDRADLAREGADRASNKLKNEFSAALEDLGLRILPMVNAEMQGLVGLLDALLSRDVQPVETIGATVASIAKRAHSNGALKATEDGDLRGALGQIVGGSGITAVLSPEKIAALSEAQRKVLREGLSLFSEYSKSAGLTAQQVNTVTENLKLLDLESASQGTSAAGSTGASGGSGGLRKVLPLTAEEKQKAIDALLDVRKAVAEFGVATEKTIAGSTKSAVDNAVAEYSALAIKIQETRNLITKKAAVRGADQGEIANQRKQLAAYADRALAAQRETIARLTREERTAIADNVLAATAAVTGNAADVARAALDKQTSALYEQINASKVLSGEEKKRLDLEVTLADQAGRANIEAQTAAQKIVALQLQIDQAKSNGTVPGASTLNGLNALSIEASQRLRDLEAKGLTNTTAYRDTQQQILDLENKRKGIVGTIATANADGAANEIKNLETIQEQARALQQAVDGALQLAAAFHLVDDATATVLRSVVQIAAGVEPLLQQIRDLQSGVLGKDGKALGSISGVIGAALPIAGAVASLAGVLGSMLGEDPAEKARLAELEKNTEALHEFTSRVGLLGTVNLSGATYGTASHVIGGILSRSGGEYDAKANLDGISESQLSALRAAAKAFNIELTDTTAGYRLLEEALRDSRFTLLEFNDDFASQRAQFEASIKVYGDKGPLASLKDFLAVLGKSSPLFESFAKTIDVDSPEGRAALREAAQRWFEAMKTGGGAINPEVAGLSGDELLSSIEQIIEYLNALEPAAVSAAEALSKARTSLTTEFEIMGTDAAGQLTKLLALYKAQGGALAELAGGDVATLDDRIKALFEQLQTAPETVDLAGMSLDQFLAALLDLKHGADAAASGVKSAAQLMQDAADALSTDFEVFGTDATGQAQGLAGLYGGVGGIGAALQGLDLSTPGGRAAAISALQSLYASNKGDAAQTSAIREILRALRAVPETGAADGSSAGGGGRASGGAGGSERQSSGAERLTVQQGDRIGALLESILVRSTETATNTRALQLLERMLRVPAFAPVLPPSFTSGGVGGGGSGVQVIIRITQVLNFNAPGSGIGAQGSASAIGQQTADAVNRSLGRQFTNDRLLTGNPVARS